MSPNIYFNQSITQELHNPTTWKVLLITIVLPCLVSFFVKRPYRKPIRCTGWLALSLYAIYTMTLLDRMDSGACQLNLQPFWTWEKALSGSQLHQYFIVGNILLFVPFGIAVAYAFPATRRKWWSVTLVGLLVSVIIEGVQYFGHLGLCEFDDVFHNTVGMVVGYGMAKVMLWLHKRLREYRKSSGESV